MNITNWNKIKINKNSDHLQTLTLKHTVSLRSTGLQYSQEPSSKVYPASSPFCIL